MDDLTKIDGIGPRRGRALNALGITTFAELAAIAPNELAEYLSIDEGMATAVTAAAADLASDVGAPTDPSDETAVLPDPVGAPTPPVIYLLTGPQQE